MNHECGSPVPPSSAVPDLPAVGTPGTFAPRRELPADRALDRRLHRRRDRLGVAGAEHPAQLLGPIVRVPLSARRCAATRCGFISTPSFATVAATSAIWSGVTNVSAWPNEADASSTSSANPPGPEPSPFVTWEAAVGRSNGSGAPNPSRPAKLARLLAAGPRPASAYQMFDDHSVAAARSNVPAAALPGARGSGSPRRPGPSCSAFGCSGNVVEGVIAPEPRPAIAVTILNTDPGT